MTAVETAALVRLPEEVNVLNLGLPLFAEAIGRQGRPVVQVDWRIPGGGDLAVVAALRRLYGPHARTVDAANQEVFRRLDRGTPHLVAVRTAADVIPVFAQGRVLLHCGPRISIERTTDPLRRSMRAAVCAEGWAGTPEEADALLRDGTVRLEPANEHGAVVPMATAMGPRTPVWVVELADAGIRTYAPVGQGSGDVAWFGRDTPGAIARLVLLREAVGPVLAAAVQEYGPVDVMSLAAQAIAMGDDVHVRTQAATNLLLRNLLPALVAGDHPRRHEAATFLSGNHLLFLSLAMAAARALTTWAAQVENSSVVTGMARNGTDFAAWLAGPSSEWFITPAPMVGRALYQPGRGQADAAPDIGDSSVLELVGLGGAAAAGSPAVAQLVGGTMAHAAELTAQLDEVCVGNSSRFMIPTWGMKGSPVGVDVRKVVELGITPQVTTGILHNADGSGQVGAGVAEAPIQVFVDALLALDAKLTGEA
ncbi:DUF1116 domain-containing protein [Streptosporangium sp. NBC_01755]|uniref:DUF1116 domain-containing protein n=1 Tax=Streptosporangium sp. NBC_01755 TaxID=2975949 RepID=UPI002DD8796D|nr:DUF1116 domain-containing protein [Streptosporangium sp. NBC_01755]WSD02118.1 DUF1116 domain-containing protein [Streptosporangium sp. NBC_01755]